jgi:hypothetical protein
MKPGFCGYGTTCDSKLLRQLKRKPWAASFRWIYREGSRWTSSEWIGEQMGLKKDDGGFGGQKVLNSWAFNRLGFF